MNLHLTPQALEMRRRKLLIRLFLVAAVVCCLAVGYFAYGRYRVSSLAARCETARQARQWQQLEDLATQWIVWEPEQAQPWLLAAEAANEQGQDVRTAGYLYYLPNDDPRTPAALLELSHLQFGNLNQPIAAAQTCERILRLKPDASEARRRLIFYYAMSRQRDKMIKQARAAIQTGSDTPETYLYLIGADWITFTNGYALNQRWLQSSPGNETFLVAAGFHEVRSRAMQESSEQPDASGISKSEQLMNDLLVRFPKNLEVLAFHLDLASFRGNEERVTELLAQAPPESIDDSRFWRFKGWVHESRSERDEAEHAYLKAIELHPFDGQSHHNLAAIYRKNQELDLVEKYQNLAVMGKEIMRDCLQVQDTNSLSDDLLGRIAIYLEQCGDDLAAISLRRRLGQ